MMRAARNRQRKRTMTRLPRRGLTTLPFPLGKIAAA
jgi:hypothetical protein